MSRLISLYPRAWRRRYGAELLALLDDRPLTLADGLDLVRGAFDAHLHPELVDPSEPVAALAESPSEDTIMARKLGVATFFGALAWITAWIVQSLGPIVTEADGTTYRDGGAAMPFLWISGALLAAGLAGQLRILPGNARLARLGAIAAIPGIILWSLVPWVPWTAALTLAGLALLAVGAQTARRWHVAASAAVMLVVVALPIVVMRVIDRGPILQVTPELIVFVTLPLVAWLVVGGTLIWPRQPSTKSA